MNHIQAELIIALPEDVKAKYLYIPTTLDYKKILVLQGVPYNYRECLMDKIPEILGVNLFAFKQLPADKRIDFLYKMPYVKMMNSEELDSFKLMESEAQASYFNHRLDVNLRK